MSVAACSRGLGMPTRSSDGAVKTAGPSAIRAIVRSLLLLCLSGPWAMLSASGGDDVAALDAERIRVGVYVSPPFVMKEASGKYSGMAVDLWEAAAQENGWKYDYVERNTFGELVDAVAEGSLHVALTNLTMTRERAERIDFTHPWYDAGMRVMVARKGADTASLLSVLHRSGHIRTYLVLGAIALLATWMLTLFDRRFDKEFPKKWRAGLAESFYHVMSVATSGKANRKNLFGAAGRVMAAIWMLCGVALVAYVTSSVTSAMTTISLTRHVNGVNDLPGKTIGVLAGSTAEQFAEAKHFDYRRFTDIDGAVEGLLDGSIIAVVADAPVLEYYAHAYPGRGVEVVGNTFSPEKYGFGLWHGAGVAKPLRVQLLGMHENGYVDEVRARYFGEGP